MLSKQKVLEGLEKIMSDTSPNEEVEIGRLQFADEVRWKIENGEFDAEKEPAKNYQYACFSCGKLLEEGLNAEKPQPESEKNPCIVCGTEYFTQKDGEVYYCEKCSNEIENHYKPEPVKTCSAHMKATFDLMELRRNSEPEKKTCGNCGWKETCIDQEDMYGENKGCDAWKKEQ